jgi:hypothetical protein
VSLQSSFSLSWFVGVRAEALAILSTMAADIFFNRWDLKVLQDCLAPYIPRCVLVMGVFYPSTQRHYRKVNLLLILYCYMFRSYDQKSKCVRYYSQSL